jgi:3-oxoadipate CoA-transferase, beta subunit
VNTRTIGTTVRGLSKDDLAARVARDIPRGAFVNLGIGLPTRISNHLTPGSGVMLQAPAGAGVAGRALQLGGDILIQAG